MGRSYNAPAREVDRDLDIYISNGCLDECEAARGRARVGDGPQRTVDGATKRAGVRDFGNSQKRSTRGAYPPTTLAGVAELGAVP